MHYIRYATALFALAASVSYAQPQHSQHLGHSHHSQLHAPAGVMYEHVHGRGEWMLDYRFSHSRSATLFQQSDEIDEAQLQSAGYSGIPQKMTMQMHMLHIMYAPTDWLNLMLMPHYMSMDMSMNMLAAGDHGEHGHSHGGTSGHHEHEVTGLGDTELSALFRLFQHRQHSFNAALAVSAPTGSVEETGADGRMLGYNMQLGSGTWDFAPALTYLGSHSRWSWGAQLSATLPLQSENKSGFRYGEQYRSTAWMALAHNQWTSGSLRLNYTNQNDISGHYNRPHNHSSPGDLQANSGGELWHIGLGLNLRIPAPAFADQQLAVEWLQPLAEHYRGYQLGGEQTLIMRWSKTL